MKRVVVGLSGGVDSSVAAYLLKQQGYDVIGIFMKNWHDDSVTLNNECPWIDDSADAMLVADKLGIPFQTIDFSEIYKSRIVDYMFAEYEKGRTPNPDVLCNREIKFDVFLQAAIKLNADFVATGHYCQKAEEIVEGKTMYKLLAGADSAKDQSYFLCQVTQQQLAKALFPVGHLQKSQVRKIAEEQNLVTANKKDSQGLCFIGKISLPDFLQQKLKPQKGKVIEIPPDCTIYNKVDKTLEEMSTSYKYSTSLGKEIGTHNGAHYYTIGQRRGLNIGGTDLPLFVIGIDTTENIIYTGKGDNHPGLYRKVLKMEPETMNFIRPDKKILSGKSQKVLARIRYRQPLNEAILHNINGVFYLEFFSPQRGITPGQFAAWYQGNELIGSGVINQ